MVVRFSCTPLIGFRQNLAGRTRRARACRSQSLRRTRPMLRGAERAPPSTSGLLRSSRSSTTSQQMPTCVPMQCKRSCTQCIRHACARPASARCVATSPAAAVGRAARARHRGGGKKCHDRLCVTSMDVVLASRPNRGPAVGTARRAVEVAQWRADCASRFDSPARVQLPSRDGACRMEAAPGERLCVARPRVHASTDGGRVHPPTRIVRPSFSR